MQHSIVYLAHGAGKFHRQTLFSVCSLLHHLLKSPTDDIRIRIYTDRPNSFPVHKLLSVHALSRRDLLELKGPLGYVHRAKLGVLAMAARAYPGPLLYVDCDTKWIKAPGPAFAQLAALARTGCPIMYMHEFEVEIQPGIWPEYHRELSAGYSFQRRLSIAKPWHMWNAGAIGLYEPGDFFAQAIAISDEILVRTRRKNWSEQLAVSLLGNTRYDIRPFDTYLRHYWRHTCQLPYVVDHALGYAARTASLADAATFCARFPVREALARLQVTPRMRVNRTLRRIRNSIEKRRLGLLSMF